MHYRLKNYAEAQNFDDDCSPEFSLIRSAQDEY